MNFVMVFIGGGLGSICRYGIGRSFNAYGGAFPLATFVANALSCVLLGMLVGYFSKNDVSQGLPLLLVVGFCGGFSTFSTFSLETLTLLQNGDYTNAFFNIVGSIIVCLICIFLGMKIMT